MAVNKKPLPKPPLSMVEIVMRADAATIQAALEARQKVDALLAERAAAYERIAALEHQIDDVVGEPGVFIFPPPSVPVAQFTAATELPPPAPKPTAPLAPKPVAPPASDSEPEPESPAKPAHSTDLPSRKGSKN
ncbi:MAG: hypothetical protein J5654_05310 [Victivallales bacterium]|nr:hypothetical protein [Victivallales bacterium]